MTLDPDSQHKRKRPPTDVAHEPNDQTEQRVQELRAQLFGEGQTENPHSPGNSPSHERQTCTTDLPSAQELLELSSFRPEEVDARVGHLARSTGDPDTVLRVTVTDKADPKTVVWEGSFVKTDDNEKELLSVMKQLHQEHGVGWSIQKQEKVDLKVHFKRLREWITEK